MRLMKAGILALTLGVAGGSIMESAEAARFGGGRSIGVQRSYTQPQRQATPPQQQGQQAAQPQGGQATAAQAAQSSNRWMAPIAGVAAGLGLGWLFAQGGMGPMLLGLLVLAGAISLIMMMARRDQDAAASATTSPWHAGAGHGAAGMPGPMRMPVEPPLSANIRSDSSAPPAAGIPAGFDVAGFLKQAKLNFIRLQEAHDCNDLALLRDVTTPELYEQLAADMEHREPSVATPHTDVVALEAALLEVVSQADRHWASVGFSGQIRESASATPAAFAEIWHLSKPVSGECGWLVSGIQQPS